MTSYVIHCKTGCDHIDILSIDKTIPFMSGFVFGEGSQRLGQILSCVGQNIKNNAILTVDAP